eukprot:1078484-Alexandrium_andersonii.AAC.1
MTHDALTQKSLKHIVLEDPANVQCSRRNSRDRQQATNRSPHAGEATTTLRPGCGVALRTLHTHCTEPDSLIGTCIPPAACQAGAASSVSDTNTQTQQGGAQRARVWGKPLATKGMVVPWWGMPHPCCDTATHGKSARTQ